MAEIKSDEKKCDLSSSFSPPVRNDTTYPISGVPVRFPVKPYSTQLQMMSKIIQALNKSQNALLESPTGSGKSLALLCSALAWQQQNKYTTCISNNEDSSNQPESTDEKVATKCQCACHNTQSTGQSDGQGLCIEQSIGESTDLSGDQFSTGQLTAQSTCTAQCSTVESTSTGQHTCQSTVQSTGQSNVQSTGQPNIQSTGQSNVQSTGQSNVQSTGQSNVQSTGQPNIQSTGQSNVQSTGQSNVQSTGQPNVQSTGQPNVQSTGKSNIQSTDCPDDGDDFKPLKKRFRTPVNKKYKRPRRGKGVVYDELDESLCDSQLTTNEHGHPTWRMEDVSKNNDASVQPEIPDLKPHPPIEPQLLEKPQPPIEPHPQMSPLIKCQSCNCLLGTESIPQEVRYRSFKIYYGTRTHKQITQITHELARTSYSSIPMVILASRDHTCIHPQVSRSKNKKEECRQLVDYKSGISCRFYHNVHQKLGQQLKLKEYGLHDAWDIEDLVQLGRKVKACPYYATRALLSEAEIIFCPYNYLIDPLIREQMLINLKDSILILDEAHNMEDASREAASLSTTSRQLSDVEDELKKLLDSELLQCRESYDLISAYVHNIRDWMETTAELLPVKKFEESCSVWNGMDFLHHFKEMGVTDKTHPLIMEHVRKIIDDTYEQPDRDDEMKGIPSPPKLSVGGLHVIDSFFIITGYLFAQERKYINDYRVCLKKTSAMLPRRSLGGWVNRQRNPPMEKVWLITLHFWCLNPAVSFSQLQVARSIILTSGTLSPMSSFSSELGVVFPIQLEANHVISQSQTWINTISHGPRGLPLNGSYQFADTFQFQDEIGAVILEVCKTVPFGVLCFVSSYKLLEKLTNRWQDTGVWYQISKMKHIVCEPRAGDKADFEIIMSQFYQKIQMATEKARRENSTMDITQDSEFDHDGALFFAVCRGKVSEGLDFADNNARAVITVGIPFPSIKDEQVALKREYNNSLCYQRGLLSGSEWYEIQAYRALNQALGRCIRHKKDWGALILIDERFNKGKKYVKGLSKWVRQRVGHCSVFNDAMRSLSDFVHTRIQEQDVSINESSFNTTTMVTPTKTSFNDQSPSSVQHRNEMPFINNTVSSVQKPNNEVPTDNNVSSCSTIQKNEVTVSSLNDKVSSHGLRQPLTSVTNNNTSMFPMQLLASFLGNNVPAQALPIQQVLSFNNSTHVRHLTPPLMNQLYIAPNNPKLSFPYPLVQLGQATCIISPKPLTNMTTPNISTNNGTPNISTNNMTPKSSGNNMTTLTNHVTTPNSSSNHVTTVPSTISSDKPTHTTNEVIVLDDSLETSSSQEHPIVHVPLPLNQTPVSDHSAMTPLNKKLEKEDTLIDDTQSTGTTNEQYIIPTCASNAVGEQCTTPCLVPNNNDIVHTSTDGGYTDDGNISTDNNKLSIKDELSINDIPDEPLIRRNVRRKRIFNQSTPRCTRSQKKKPLLASEEEDALSVLELPSLMCNQCKAQTTSKFNINSTIMTLQDAIETDPSSKLMSLFQSLDSVYVFSSNLLQSTAVSQLSSGSLNAVWEDNGLCYSILQCMCHQVIGIKVNKCDWSKTIEGQAILDVNQVSY